MTDDYTRSYKKFIIFATPRSGTHMLRSSLMAHPNVVVHPEMFNPGTPAFLPYPLSESPDSILRNHIYHPYDNSTHAVGFPIHDFQFFAKPNPHWKEVWYRLSEIKDLKIIRLQRDNLAEQFVSNVIARRTGQWWLYYKKQPKDKNRQLRCQPEKMEQYFKRLQEWQAKLEPLFASHQQLSVVYEPLIANYHDEMQRIQNFLGLAPDRLMPSTTKQDRRTLSDRLENFSELKAYFASSEYSRFFEDQ